ncbi:MAG: acetyl-CoA carboxylase biotin carboxylase subunit, partial [Candidatus Dormibacteria bacterium]
LVANRGEIAIRIARAARDEGIAPVGIFSTADRHALHVGAMDDARCIGPAPAGESYLNVEHVLAAARELGADAIHPGYGFLSENAAFARAAIAAGLSFVGPPPDALAATGDKSAAKQRARSVNVPVVPGYDGDDQTDERLRSEAPKIGLPLLVKAVAGGGGRGMRVVGDLSELDQAIAAARREALAAFGDARLLLERYVERPRHVEVQILADMHGNVVFLGERECSIQRRHQKIVEESPSRAVTPELRAELGAAAVRYARAVGYVNAGTVEFLLDAAGAFYFLEMNARLQVEHPVTEIAFGVDLARSQFRIARGEPLDFVQAKLQPKAWAIEVRLCAEDPGRDFLPSSGTIARFEIAPATGVRVDAGYAAGSEVSIYYDSLLAKIIGSGATRDDAIAQLDAALGASDVTGVRTNLGFLREVLRDPAFRAGEATTAFIAERGAALT